jgi:hypothetical protein
VTRRTLPILLALALSLAWSASAFGLSLGQRIIGDYLQSGNTISACKFTTKELKDAKNSIPEDLRQYGAALIAALDDAIAARAQGACDKSKQNAAAPAVATQTPPPAAGPSATGVGASGSAASPTATAGVPTAAQAPPTPTAEPSPATALAHDDSIALASHATDVASDPPVPVLLLAVLAGLLALGALMFGLMRWLAWEPAWAVRFRHAAGEAGWRASSTFSEFADFVRLGR